MTHDGAPHRVLNINELARLVANQLIPINRKSAVNLACVCRYLEEPVLSTLWETQTSLCTLLRRCLEILGVGNIRDLLKAWYVAGISCLGNRTLDSRPISDQDRGGTITRCLEPSPALRFLDAPCLCG